MLSHLHTRLFLQLGAASLALQPVILLFRFDGSVAAHGLLSTLIASFTSCAVTLLLLWAIVARRSLLAAIAWIVIALVAVFEMINDTANGWLFQPQHVLGGISLLLDAACAALLLKALLDHRRHGPNLKTAT